MSELYNELVSPASEGGLEEAKYFATFEVIISDTILRNIIPVHIRRMQEQNKTFVGMIIATQPLVCNTHLTCGGKKVKTLTNGLESVCPSQRQVTLEATVHSY